MRSNKTILFFFLKFIIIYGILLGFYTIVKDTFREILISEGNFFLGKMDGERSKFVFSPYNENENKTEIRIVMQNLEKKANEVNATQIKFDSMFMAYIPFALMISLIGASSISGKRKIYAMISGVLIINIFVIFKIIILVYYVCNNSHPSVELLVLTPEKLKAVSFISTKIVEPLPPTLIFVSLIWILLVFRKADFLRITDSGLHKKGV